MQVLDHGEIDLQYVTASDEMVLAAMLISTGKDKAVDLRTNVRVDADDLPVVKKNRGRINYLMREHHGTPFEHNFFCFRVTAPIFVWREWHRHRIGWSYNEQSGRYMQLGDKWYIPTEVRTRVGKPGHYTYEAASMAVRNSLRSILSIQCAQSYGHYLDALKGGVAPEQARLFLHVNHYSSCYATCNARSLMNFIALRNNPTAQWEIQQYAQMVEGFFAEAMPVTYEAFIANGRVAP